ncbi:MAG TPA: glycosyltransferase family 4 protein [Gemmatales bacterium]|nr:glycosyltransferase family 4 protein [Gemmatales bacterium]HMP15732.1 glycosyltransferase family 4 protein [Gemmatales bacterium]
MNIIALGKDARHVCVRYRMAPLQAEMRQQGHWFSIQGMPRTPWGRLSLYREIRHAQMVLVQRRLLSTWEVALLRKSSRKLIFDFDDACFQRNSYHKDQKASRRLARFRAMVQAADIVVAGNDYLAACAAEHTSADKVHIIPTCVDVRKYSMAQHQRCGAGVRLVWIGSASTLRGLEEQAALWNLLGETLPGLELHVICDRFPRFSSLPVIPIRWNQFEEAKMLAACDIGIAHMPDDDWSRGKCGLKVLQYQAAGLPVVTTPVGVNRDMVKHGTHGYWATSPHDWMDAIQRLMHAPELRQQMGKAGRQQVENNFSVAQLVNRWRPLFHQLATSKAVA